MNETFQPLGDRILVKRLKEEETYKGIIHLPEKGMEKPTVATVIAVGEGTWLDGDLHKPLVEIGDKVLFGKYTGTDIRLGEEEFTVMREGDVLGILHAHD